MMESKVQQSLTAAIAGIAAGRAGVLTDDIRPEQDLTAFYEHLSEIFDREDDFMEKLSDFDGLFAGYPGLASLQGFFFDLLLINFFSSAARQLEEDYLESPEWEEIEDKTIDRGTEMLNIFLYLKECQENGVAPELGDFLSEFLLVEEEEFQDEHEVYEDVIARQVLVESSYGEIARAAEKLPEDSPVKTIFYPLMGFFYNTDPSLADMKEFFRESADKTFDSALLFAILAYHNGLSLWKP